jgi:S1-C subfamily serine protease
MDRSDSSFEFGEPFEDPDDLFEDLEGYRGEEEPNSCGSVGGIPEGMIGDESTLRGWIPPDDRLWIHPSEIGRELRVDAVVEARRRARRSDRRGIIAAGIVGTAALTAAVAAVALAASSPSQLVTSSPLTSSTTHLTSSDTSSLSQTIHEVSAAQACLAMMSQTSCAAIERVQPSILRIVVGESPHTSAGTAVVVSTSAETVAITAASLVGAAKTVRASDPTGKVHTLEVIGVDEETGIAAIGVPWKMPAAETAQESVFPGQYFPVLASDGRSTDFLHAEMGEVYASSASTSKLMDSFGVELSIAAPGGVLLDSTGAVIGLLSITGRSDTDITGEFVPSWLAVGVAKRLLAEHRVVHGWLDVQCANAKGKTGAVLVSVPATGPGAHAGLKAGDLVVGITTAGRTEPIRSMDDLRGRLYLEPPGAKVDLEVMRGNQELVLTPVLEAALS